MTGGWFWPELPPVPWAVRGPRRVAPGIVFSLTCACPHPLSMLPLSTQCAALADAVRCVGGCSAPRWQMQCAVLADAVRCVGGCSAPRWQMQCSALTVQPRPDGQRVRTLSVPHGGQLCVEEGHPRASRPTGRACVPPSRSVPVPFSACRPATPGFRVIRLPPGLWFPVRL